MPEDPPLLNQCRFCGETKSTVHWKNCVFEHQVMGRHVMEYICPECEDLHWLEIPLAPAEIAS